MAISHIMRRTKTEKIDALVEKIMQDIARQGDNYQHLIIAEWRQMLGVTVSNATRKIFIKDKKLFVYLDSPIIKQEIIHLKSKIIEHFNSLDRHREAASKEALWGLI